ncbi:hypothetical protein SM033_00207 [Vibrio phage vB_VpaM_sm033]|nr:hypothetical protein SM033_00207 [Vibrio phage vB_VpaM_sm033]
MYKLIDKQRTLTYGGKVDPEVDRLLIQHRINAERTIQRYQTNYKQVSGRNPLIRLAYAILSYRIEEPMKAYNVARDYFHEIAGPLGFTTSTHHGKSHYEFFGGVPTIIMAQDNANPAEYIISGKNYASMQPLKVIHVPTPENNLVRPDIAEHTYGYGVMSIDIPLFALSLTRWMKDNLAKPMEDREDVAVFVGRYTLPNAMYSQADAWPLAMWDNENEDMVGSAGEMLVPHVGKDLFKEIQRFKKTLTKATVVEDALKQIPGVFTENQYMNLKFPDAYVPMQQHWAYTAAFMRPYKVALTIASDNQDGRRLKNRYKKESRRISSEGTIKKLSDDIMREEMKLELMNIDAYMSEL